MHISRPVRSDVADHAVDQWRSAAPGSGVRQPGSRSHEPDTRQSDFGSKNGLRGFVTCFVLRLSMTESATVDEMKRVALIVVAALVLIASVGVAVRVRSRAAAATMLPPLPDLAGQPPAVVEHLRNADAQARRDPASADAVGALGMAYHADLFYDAAADAYRAAARPRSRRLAMELLARRWSTSNAARPRRPPRACARSSRPTRAWRWRGCGSATRSSSARAISEADEAYGRAEARRAQRQASGAAAAAASPARRETIPVGRLRCVGTRARRAPAGPRRAAQAIAREARRETRRDSAPRIGLLGDTYRAPRRRATRRRVTWRAPRRCRPTTPRRIRWSTRWRASRAAASCCSSRPSAADLVRDARVARVPAPARARVRRRQPRRRLRDGRAAAAVEASARRRCRTSSVISTWSTTISRRWSRSASATRISDGSRKPRPRSAAPSPSRTMPLG